MNPNTTHRRITSALGEHLIALLTVAVVILAVLTTLPAVMAQTEGTASRAQDRVNLPLLAAAELDSTP